MVMEIYRVMVYIIFISFAFISLYINNKDRAIASKKVLHYTHKRKIFNVISSIFLHNKIEGCAIRSFSFLSLIQIVKQQRRALSYPKEPIIFLLHNIFACDRMRIIFFSRSGHWEGASRVNIYFSRARVRREKKNVYTEHKNIHLEYYCCCVCPLSHLLENILRT